METQTYVAPAISLEEDEGYERLLAAVQNFSDSSIERNPVPSLDLETAEAKDPIIEFLGSCLTERQNEVVKMAGKGVGGLSATDSRLWSKIRSNILKHPSVVGGISKIEKKLEKQNRPEEPTIGIREVLFNVMDEPRWKKRAACRGDTRFVSPGTKSPETKLGLLAICDGCPVYNNCLAYVDEKRPESNFWAGVSRTKEGKNKSSGYHEDGSLITIEEEKENLQEHIKEKEDRKRTRHK